MIFCYLDDCLLGIIAGPAEFDAPHCTVTWLSSSLGKVGAFAYSQPNVPGSTHQYSRGLSLADPGEGRYDSLGRVHMMGAAMVLRRCWWAPARTWLQILGYLASLVDVVPDY